MIKNIIVPVDFSEDALHGLDVAVLLSQYGYVNIQLVYVQKKSGDYRGSVDDEKKMAIREFEKILGQYESRLGNESKLRYIIKQGKIYAEIVNQAHSYNDSMIVTSTHGASGFEEIFIGSNAFKVITATTRPVITVRHGNVPKAIKKIVLPINAISETRQKVPFTVDYARFFGAEIHCIAVCASRDEKIQRKLNAYHNQVKKYLDDRNINYKHASLMGENVSDLTVNYAHEVDADIISIIGEKDSSLSLISGSYGHQVINNANTLVLNLSPRDLKIAGSFRTTG